MTVRQTSKEAYSTLKEEGTMGKQSAIIYDFLKKTGVPKTLRQIKEATGIDINAVSGRVNWLKNNNYLKEAERVKCPITKRTVNPVTVL